MMDPKEKDRGRWSSRDWWEVHRPTQLPQRWLLSPQKQLRPLRGEFEVQVQVIKKKKDTLNENSVKSHNIELQNH